MAAYGRIHQTGADVALVATLPGWGTHIPGYPDEAEAIACRAQSTGSTVRPHSTTKRTGSTHQAFAIGSPAGWSRILARKEFALPSDVITYRNYPVPLH